MLLCGAFISMVQATESRDEKECHPIPQSEFCRSGFASLTPDGIVVIVANLKEASRCTFLCRLLLSQAVLANKGKSALEFRAQVCFRSGNLDKLSG